MKSHHVKDRASGTSSEKNAAQGANSPKIVQPPSSIITADDTITYVTGKNYRDVFLVTETKKWRDIVQPDIIDAPEEIIQSYPRKYIDENYKNGKYFIFGEFNPLKRSNKNIISRNAAVLDLDGYTSEKDHPEKDRNPLPSFDDMVNHIKDTFNGVAFGIYTTFSSTKKYPKYRIIIPLAAPVAASKYEGVAKRVAQAIGIDMVDRASFTPAQAMYTPRCFSFSHDYASKFIEGVPLEIKKIQTPEHTPTTKTKTTQKNITPLYSEEEKNYNKEKYTPSPLESAFLAVYPTIQQARDKYLSDILLETNDANKYTHYEATKSKSGISVFSDGQLVQSHHTQADAKNCGKTYNSFKMVMHYRFEGTPLEKRKKLEKLLKDDAAVQAELTKIAQKKYKADPSVFGLLELNHFKKPVESIDNVSIILEHDPVFKGKMKYNELSCEEEICWDEKDIKKTSSEWRDADDTDDALIRRYIGKFYKINNREKIRDAVRIHYRNNKYDPVKKLIEGLKWDGVPRLETMFIDYFGAAPDVYSREVARSLVMGIIQRNLVPGSQYELVPILIGAQGIGKGQFLRALSLDYYTDSLGDFNTRKQLGESIEGYVLAELGEMDIINKAAINTVKKVVSMQSDKFRKAFDRKESKLKRRIVFVGTSNEIAVLRDDTGNRRFLPLKLHSKKLKENDKLKKLVKRVKGTNKLTDEGRATIEQIWAEAKHLYDKGVSVVLNDEAEEIAEKRQELFSEQAQDPRRGIVTAYLDAPYKDKEGVPSEPHIKKTEVCIAEIAKVAFGASPANSREFGAAKTYIKSVMESLNTWERMKKSKRFGDYGVQRIWYQRIAGADKSEVEQKVDSES